MVSTVIKNWDNETWLSSQKYISSFNKFIINNINFNTDYKILDVGCGRGKILGSLSSKLKLKYKPIGIDIVNHRDRDRRIKFKKMNALTFISKNKKKFDLILIKQTIHLLNLKDIEKLLRLLKKNLNSKGKILIFSLDTSKNEIPTFKLMKKKLSESLKRDKRILKIIDKFNPKRVKKKFSFKVKIAKKDYLRMIQRKYISTLLYFSNKQIKEGMDEIDSKYKNILNFKDKLICIKL
jgi:ubiquinone/menaquinone biosynthesis C-methylase UbiE